MLLIELSKVLPIQDYSTNFKSISITNNNIWLENWVNDEYYSGHFTVKKERIGEQLSDAEVNSIIQIINEQPGKTHYDEKGMIIKGFENIITLVALNPSSYSLQICNSNHSLLPWPTLRKMVEENRAFSIDKSHFIYSDNNGIHTINTPFNQNEMSKIRDYFTSISINSAPLGSGINIVDGSAHIGTTAMIQLQNKSFALLHFWAGEVSSIQYFGA